LIVGDGLALEEQSSDERRFPVVDAAAGEEAKQFSVGHSAASCWLSLNTRVRLHQK
jgi:hypothetical protein